MFETRDREDILNLLIEEQGLRFDEVELVFLLNRIVNALKQIEAVVDDRQRCFEVVRDGVDKLGQGADTLFFEDEFHRLLVSAFQRFFDRFASGNIL